MFQARPPVCPYCCQPMNLIRTISAAASPLFLFHCSRCNHATTKQQKSASAIRELNLERRRHRASKQA
jgi:hypothetical protein